ncbi:hypothetical protein J3E71DRAFT_209112 [Bipolaris maydis]|nr:hypothetical protein J3E71DRAFT_209112 [Bipolaris maydis]
MDSQPRRILKPLLPSTGPKPNRPILVAPKRLKRIVACEACRVKKTKASLFHILINCSGERPICSRCKTLDIDCEYAVESGDENRRVTLKRRYDQVEAERDQLRELFDLIRERPDTEAYEFFRRIRTSSDSVQVLRLVRQAHILLPNPTPTSPVSSHPEIEKLDSEALRRSPLKLRARPWTLVARDGIVSSLVSSFFAWDGNYMTPFIDLKCFLKNMDAGNLAVTEFCSPFLVNAICCVSFFSTKVKKILTVSAYDLIKAFDAEARRHLGHVRETPSLATVQGLLIMFVVSCYLGQDKAGVIYRHLGYDMLDRLYIENRLETTRDPLAKQVYCKAQWGIYCYESILASFHGRLPAIRMPIVPRLFHLPEWDQEVCRNIDILNEPYTSASYRPPFAPGVFNAQCNLTVFEHEVSQFNKDVLESETPENLGARKRLYERLKALRKALPSHLRNERNSTPGTNILRIHFDEIAMFILRPVQAELIFADEATTRDLRIEHCQYVVEVAECHFRTQLSSDYTIMFMHGCFHVCLTLVPFLDETICQDLFTRAAGALRRGVWDIPAMRLVMSAIEAVVWAMGKKVPPAARASFMGEAPKDVKDVSPEWGFPQMEYVQSLPGREPENLREISEVRGSLGALLEKWNALTL